MCTPKDQIFWLFLNATGTAQRKDPPFGAEMQNRVSKGFRSLEKSLVAQRLSAVAGMEREAGGRSVALTGVLEVGAAGWLTTTIIPRAWDHLKHLKLKEEHVL